MLLNYPLDNIFELGLDISFFPILIKTFWLSITHDPSFSMFTFLSIAYSSRILVLFNMQDIALRHSLQLIIRLHSLDFCHTLARHIFKFNEPRLLGAGFATL